MALGIIYRAPEGEALAAAMIGESICIQNPRRNGRRHLKLYRDKSGRPFVRTRLGVRYVRSIVFLTIDGRPLECGAAKLEESE